jgi:hypothetical protein
MLKKVKNYMDVLIRAIIEKGLDVKKEIGIPPVTLQFLKDFAEKEEQLTKITSLKVDNLTGTFQIILKNK